MNCSQDNTVIVNHSKFDSQTNQKHHLPAKQKQSGNISKLLLDGGGLNTSIVEVDYDTNTDNFSEKNQEALELHTMTENNQPISQNDV